MKKLVLPDNGTEKPLVYYLAVEEYVARHLEDDVLFLWQTGPTVISGRNQVIEAEADLEYCKAHGIDVFRRKSGGGTVYSDKGNIMVSCIVSCQDVPYVFEKYLQSAALYLRSAGIDASVSGRNDIIAGGRKVSGNAFYKAGRRGIIHGTMLFDTDFDMMEKALDGFAPSVLDSREVAYRCDCSRERTREMLLSLGRKELEKLRDEDPHCEVVCHFCHAKYEFDLNKLLKELPAQA